MKRVLHLVESYGGGLQSALQAYLERTPEYTHLVLAHSRDDIATKLPPTVTVVPMKKSLVAQYRAGAKAIREFSPEVIHAHSSWAGFYGRMLGRRFGVPVVYSPHAFAFLRTDQRKLARRAYLGVERRLGRSTTAYVTASAYEAYLASRFSVGASHHIAFPALSPSTLRYLANQNLLHDDADKSYDIALLGRLVPQKSPEFLVETLTRMRRAGWTGSVKWIGHGPTRYLKMMKKAGVEVTGWLPRNEALETLSQARILFHCGEWEAGTPYAVLEGAAIGLPIVMRSLPSAEDLDGCALGATPSECSRWMLSLLCSDARYEDARKHALGLVDEKWGILQREALIDAYEVAAPSLEDVKPLPVPVHAERELTSIS